MTVFSVLAHLGVAFLGFLVGTIITCIILVKKNGERYVQIQEEVRKGKANIIYDNEKDEEDSGTEDTADLD